MVKRNCYQVTLGFLLACPILLTPARLAIAGAGHDHGPQFKTQGGSAPVAINLETAQQLGILTEVVKAQPFDRALKATGTIESVPNRQALVTAPVKGKIVSLLVEPGASVRQGQAIATITSAELSDLRNTSKEKRAELWASVQQSKTNLQLAQSNESRYRAIAAAEISRAKDSLTAAQAQYDRDLSLVQDRSVVKVARENYQRQKTIAQSEIAQAQTEVDVAVERYEQDRKLVASGALPRRQMLESQALLSAARTKLAKAKQQPEVLTAASELRKAETEVPIRAQQESATKLAEARANLVTASTRKELVAATAEIQRAQAALTAAQTKFDLADRSYFTRLKQLGTSADSNGLITIKAPIDGTVVDRPATVGQTVVEGETKLMTVTNNSTVIATAQVYEKDLPQLAVGQAVNVRVAGLGDRLLKSTISLISSQVDQRRTVAVQSQLSNADSSLKAGMFAELEIITGQSDQAVISMPSSALVDVNGKKQVYVQNNNSFQPVTVTLGQTAGDRVEVKAGLFAGDRVVTQGAMSLYAQSLRGDGGGTEAGHEGDDHGEQGEKAGTAKSNILGLSFLPSWALPAGMGTAVGGGLLIGLWQYRRRRSSDVVANPLDVDIDRAITAVLLEETLPEPRLTSTEGSESLPLLSGDSSEMISGDRTPESSASC